MKHMDSNASQTLVSLLVCVGFLSVASAEQKPMEIVLSEWLENGIMARDPAAKDKRCVVADASRLSGLVFDADTPTLQPGVYRAVIKLKLPKINNVNTAPLQWDIDVQGAGRGQRSFDILMIERSGIYQEIPCDFVVLRSGEASIALSWNRAALLPNKRAQVRVENKDIPKVNDIVDLKDDLETEEEIEAELSEEPPLAGLKYLYMAVDSLKIVPVSDVDVAQLEVDKVRYKPGEQAKVSVSVRNYSSKSRKLRVETVFIHDLDTVIPLDERSLSVEEGMSREWVITGPAFKQKWGYAVRCRVYEGERLLTGKSEYFTVHGNMWAVAITGRGAAQFTAHVSRENAKEAARSNKRQYRNFVESGFWAPDEFGDFTPDTETWWGGQGNYYGSVKGTQIQIEEGHKVGLSYAVYSNIWGGDGPPAFELMRRKPDWGYASTFNVAWFERWNRNPMGTGSHKFPMHVFPITIIKNSVKNEGPIRHHGRELIGTHKMFGWDAVRYDSHGISDQNARLVRITKEVVHAEVPEFQFGYNSSVPQRDPSMANAFKVHCEGGGGIMEEGIRQYGGGGMSFSGGATYHAFAKRLLDFKEEAREFGGHFMAIGTDKQFPNDLVYQYIFWLAGNTHTVYDWKDVSVANYLQFATRFAGQLWDLKVTPLKKPEKWLDIGEAKKFLWMWKKFVHQRDLGNGRRQLIVHLINSPAEKVLYTNDDAKVPPPRENVKLFVKLPDRAKVRNVWFLTPEYQLTQRRLGFGNEKVGGITFVVPRIRFWSTAVVDMENAKAFE